MTIYAWFSPYTCNDVSLKLQDGVDTVDNHSSEINKMKSNLPVPSKIFPHDRHRDIHDVVGRPKLVQRAVLVVDTLQENLEI